MYCLNFRCLRESAQWLSQGGWSDMASIRKGDTIGAQCKISGGVLPGELGITVDTKTGPVSGFVREDAIRRTPTATYIIGVVLDVKDDTVVARLRGSFFTTNGIAYFPTSAVKQLEMA